MPRIPQHIALTFALIVSIVCTVSASQRITFKRITSLADLTSDGTYIIGAKIDVTEQGGYVGSDFGGLSASSSNSVLSGLSTSYSEAPATQEATDELSSWKISTSGNAEIVLISAQTEASIYVPSADKSSLSTSKTASTTWTVSENADGTFRFKGIASSGSTPRYLGCMYLNKKFSFGHYTEKGASTIDLYVYKAAKEGIINSSILKNGENLAIAAGIFAADAQLQTFDASDLQLADGTLAPDTLLGRWSLTDKTDTTFKLQSPTGSYLGYELKPTDDAVTWTVDKQFLATTEATPRYLMFKNREFCLSETLDDDFEEIATLLQIAEAPTSRDFSQVRVLAGGWSASKLAKLDWTLCNIIDATRISWPTAFTNFENRPSESNALLYVSADAAAIIPSACAPTVVAAPTEEEGEVGRGYLLAPFTLTDKSPLAIEAEIDINAGDIGYSRAAYSDGNWETLFLPFEADVPADFQACVAKEVTDAAITFCQASTIPANTPAIIRYVGARTQSATFEVSSSATTLLPYSKATEADESSSSINFVGTLTDITIDGSTSETFFFLDTSGKSFVRALEGSHLAPFRAYVSSATATTTPRYQIQLEESLSAGIAENDIIAPENGKSALPESVFDLSGRRVRATSPAEMRQLKPGIYISNGKKVQIH